MDESGNPSPLQGTDKLTITDTAIIKANADGVGGEAGSIFVEAKGVVNVAGELSATAQAGEGGEIELEADGGQLVVSGRVDASGNVRGGEIDIGDFGLDDTFDRNTTSVTVTDTATIKSDGLENGNGGLMFVGGSELTQVDGTLSAQGGSVSGDGGLVTTASLGTIVINSSPNASATNGSAGSWVLAADALTVDADKASVISGTLNTGTNVSLIGLGTITEAELDGIILTRTGFDVSADDFPDFPFVVSDDNTEATNVVAKTASSGGIEIDADIIKTTGGDASLSLDAQDTIAINTSISTTSGKLDVNAKANQISVAGTIDTSGVTQGGAVALESATNLNVTDTATIKTDTTGSQGNGGSISLQANGDINIDGKLSTVSQAGAGGDVAITGDKIIASGEINASGASAGGNVSLRGNGFLSGAGEVTIADSGKIIANALISGIGGGIFINSLTTQVRGLLSAKGGSSSGNGGSIGIVAGGDGPGNDIASSINVEEQATITTRAGGSLAADNNTAIGNGGSVDFGADNVQIQGTVSTSGSSSGHGGVVTVRGEDITIGGTLNANGGVSGDGGSIAVTAIDGSNESLITKVNVQQQALLTAREGEQSSLDDTTVDNSSNFITLSAKQISVSGSLDTSGLNQGGFIDIGNTFVDTASQRQGTNVLNITDSSVIKTNASQGKAGNIIVKANDTTTIAGQLSAVAQVGTGGKVVAEGDQITVSGVVDTSGNTEGGKIEIGEIALDDTAAVDNTKSVAITGTATLRTDGLENGNGGQLLVASLDSMQIEGNLSAQGGSVAGDGGLIATTSLGALTITQSPNASAANGKAGNWVLAEDGLTVDADKAGIVSGTLNTGTNMALIGIGTLTETELDQIILTRTGFNVSDGDGGTSSEEVVASVNNNLQDFLRKTASSGGIEIDGAITKTAGGDVSLSLDADDTIAVNAPISSTSGQLMIALNTSTGSSDSVSVNAFVDTNGGGFNAPTGVVNPEPQPPTEPVTEPVTTPNVDEAVDNVTNTTVDVAQEANEVSESTNIANREKVETNEDEENEDKDGKSNTLKDKDEEIKDKGTKASPSPKQC